MIVILMLTITLSLSGCTEEKSKNSENINKILGTWFGWENFGYGFNWYSNWTFYENNSLKIIEESGFPEWGSYKIKGDEIDIITDFMDDDTMTKWYILSFSEENKHLTLTNKHYERDRAEFFKDGYRGEFYQKVIPLIGKWTNQTQNAYDDEKIAYQNYTFYENFSYIHKRNVYSDNINEYTTNVGGFYINDNNYLCALYDCYEYSIVDNKLIYNGVEYTKVE